jgi:sugar lactone lactonase YvrE
MDANRFDRLVRLLGGTTTRYGVPSTQLSRRGAAVLVAGTMASVGLGGDLAAKKNHKGKKKGKGKKKNKNKKQRRLATPAGSLPAGPPGDPVPLGCCDQAGATCFLRTWGTIGSLPREFNLPRGVAVEPAGSPLAGTVYVTDTENDRVQHFAADGTFLREWGKFGTETSDFNYPSAVAVDANGAVYVADAFNARVLIFSPTGAYLNELGTSGTGDGEFNATDGVAVAPNGTIYVADRAGRIQYFSASGVYQDQWGSEGADDEEFYRPNGIAVAPNGTVYVADSGNDRVQYFDPVGGFLGKWGQFGDANGEFSNPYAIAVTPDGTVYVEEAGNCRVQVFNADGSAFLRKWGTQGAPTGSSNSPLASRWRRTAPCMSGIPATTASRSFASICHEVRGRAE